MAGASVILSPERQRAGARLLELMDEMSFGAVGAAWIYSRETDVWWYLLVTPMIDNKGPRWIVERLFPVFEKYPLPVGVTPLDLRISSPQEQWFQDMPLAGNHITFTDTIVGDDYVDILHVYRLDKRQQFAGDRVRLFDSRVRELLAA